MANIPTSFDEYTPQVIAEIMFDPRQTISTMFWRSFFNPRTVMSEQAEIRFDEIDKSRRIAPFMVPNMPGRPIYRDEGSRIKVFRPAYTKPKDAVDPSDHLFETAPEVSRRVGPYTASERMAMRVMNIARTHRESIERLWDYMCAMALVNGKLDVKTATDSGIEPMVTIDFDRTAANTVAYNANHNWAGANFDILNHINDLTDQIADTKFGGRVTDVLMGTKAANQFRDFFRKSTRGKDYLDLETSGAEQVMIQRGVVRADPMNPFTYLGQMDAGLHCWKIQGPGNTFENDDYTFTKVVGDWDVILTSSMTEMVLAYGAIVDVDNLMPATMWSKSWISQDPSKRYIMTQSAPLAIPIYPNATMKITVGTG